MATIDAVQTSVYAALSRAAYQGEAVPLGWSIIKTESLSNGFAATAFKNESGEIVVAYRGTDEFKDLTGADLDIALQNTPRQLDAARDFLDRIQRDPDNQGSTVSITGHSLGGALAQLVAAQMGNAAYTYNAPGVLGILRDIDPQRFANVDPATFTNINNFNMRLDVVSTHGDQLGTSYNYEPTTLEGIKFFTGVMATLVNPTVGVVILANGALGQHYIERIQEAILVEKPTDIIDGYIYDEPTGTWYQSDGSGVLVDADLSIAETLSAQRSTNLVYNQNLDLARDQLRQYQNWTSATQLLREKYGTVYASFHACDGCEVVTGYVLDSERRIVGELEARVDGIIVRPVDGTEEFTVDQGVELLKKDSGSDTLVDAFEGRTLIDALSLLRAIQAGGPLPVISSGLQLATRLNSTDLTLNGASNIAAGALSVLSLKNALDRGDTLSAITAGAQAFSYGAQAYLSLVGNDTGLKSAVDFLRDTPNIDAAGNVVSTTPGALSYLNIVNSLAHGDATGAAINALALYPPTAPIAIAYQVFNLVSGLFGDDDYDPPPEPWGTASAGWSGFNVVANAAGEHGGLEAVRSTMTGFIDYLNQLAANQQALNPGSAVGVIANRLPSISYRGYFGYQLTDIDPVSGMQSDSGIKYYVTGQSFSEQFLSAAIARGAIAPIWEVKTASLQALAGDPQAGLSEEERAGRNGQLAPPLSGDTQTFRPVALDLDGDGIETTGTTRSVAFDVDDSGFLKDTAWLGSDDAFLFLDRNLNGLIDSGKELFSNGAVALGARGLAGMRWIDSNYDQLITEADPVWQELKVWQDADGDGEADIGEVNGLSALGITSLDYVLGRFEQNGTIKQLASPDLAADTEGVRTHVIPEGILIETSGGQTSLIVTRIDDRTVIEANRDGVTALEDVETIISGADLTANDMLGGFLGADLTIAGVSNFIHGTGFLDDNGFVHFNPETNYYGPASFDYTIQAPTGQTDTATVDITLTSVNDAPVITGVLIETIDLYAESGFDPFFEGIIYQIGSIYSYDPDGDSSRLTYRLVSAPVYGSVQMNQGGDFTHYSGCASTGPDPFLASVTDEKGASTFVTVPTYNYDVSFTCNHGGGGGGGKPIAIDLSDNGFSFTDVNDSNVFYDINGDGFRHRTAWPTADDGLLAYDLDGNGLIEKQGEISFTSYLPGAQTDLEGLKAFDTNNDGVLSSADEKWAKFGVWQDVDQDGVTDAGEFRTLSELGMQSMALTSDGQFAVVNGQTIHGIGTITKTDGSTLGFADVTLRYTNEVLIQNTDGTSQVVMREPFSPSGEELTGTEDNDLILGKTGNNIVYAYGGNDVVFEDGGNDVVDGGAGDDTIYSGADNDIVLGGDGNDVVFAGNGNDLVLGGDGNDALLAEAGNDVVFGGDGNDLVAGGYGNDVLSGDRGNDQVYGESGNDALFGMAGDDELAGMGGHDLLNGGDGNDLLDGGDGIDQMTGGTGDDIYVVDNVEDTVVENPNEGTDTVRTSIDYTLGANVENLTLTGTADLNGTGNELDNVLTGNVGANMLAGGAGNDTLDGGAGADNLIGGTGDDLYGVDNAGDTVNENPGEGNDTVRASVSYALTGNVENLALTGLADIDGTGNELDNVMVGNRGANVLDGGAGADTLMGGRGDDTYIVDNLGDTVVEHAGEGNDTVFSFLSYTLGSNAENLTLTGTAALNGTGNELNNVLVGNSETNTLIGNAGNDTLVGGAGNDTYIFSLGDGSDTILDISGMDTLRFGASIAPGSLTTEVSGNDLLVHVGNDTLTIQNWSLGADYRVEQIRFDDGSSYDAEWLDSLSRHVPELTIPVPDQAANEDGSFNINLSGFFTDKDLDRGDRLAYSATLPDGADLPAWLGIDSVTGTLTGLADNSEVGDYDIVVTVTDRDGQSVSDAFRLTIKNVNDNPVLANALVDLATDEDAPFSFTVTATTFDDDDFIHGDRLTLSAALADGSVLPDWLTFDASTSTFSGIPDNWAVANYEIRVMATDTAGLSVSDVFSLTVNNINDNPILANALGDLATDEDAPFSFVVPTDTFDDDDFIHGDSLTLSAALADGSVLPDWLVFDAATGTFAGTPDNWDVGTYNVRVTATDSAGTSAFDDFTLKVNNVNDAPIVANPLADQIVDEDTLFSLSLTDVFGDDDLIHGDTLTLSAALADGSILPDWLSFDASAGTFTGTPDNWDVGNYAIRVTATDAAGASADDVFAVTVNNTNDIPIIANSIVDQSTDEDSPYTFSLTDVFTDDDLIHGDSLTLSASLADGSALPDWLIFDATTGMFSGTPDNWQVGTYDIRVTATDLAGTNASDVFTLTVNNVNDNPILAHALDDLATDEDAPFSFTVPANTFDDDDFIHGDRLTLSATLADGSGLPDWLVFDADTGTFTGTPDNWDVGSYGIRLTATDTAGTSVSNVFSLTVNNVNDAPVLANAIPDQLATEGSAFSYALAGDTFSDDDAIHGDTLSYTASLADSTALPSWLAFDAATQTFSGAASTDSVLVGTDGNDTLIDTDTGISGTWDVKVTATDTAGISAEDTFTLTLQGVAGNDTLTGGKGNDVLNGGGGNDTYIYNLGDGLDTLADREGQDTVSLGADLTFDNTVIRTEGGVAHLRFLDACGCETQEGMDITLNPDGSSPIETFAFADGTSYTLADLTIQQKTWYGDNKANTLITGRHDDTIYAGKGGDTVYSGTGHDTLYGEKGNDKLYGEGGNDALYGDKGDDYLNGGCGNDLLDGGKGHNTLIGGEGNDTLILGKDGENTILFNQGDGWDTLKTATKDEGHDNDIHFGNGITQENLWFTRNGDNLLINVLGTHDGMTLEGWYANKHRPIEEIKTANGYELEDKQIELLVQAMAAFSPLPGGGNVLPTEMPESLQPVLAAAWES